jgi:hypothetical protein
MTKMTVESATALITASIDARIAKMRDAGNESQAKKWERERAHFILPSAVEFLVANATEDLAKLGDLAIYAVEKVRKIVRFATLEKGAMDNYSRHLLKQAAVCKRKNMPFSYGLQRAALSESIEFENAHKLGSRLKCSPGTANSQASSSHIALAWLGMGKNVQRSADPNADCNYSIFDLEHPVVMAAMGKKAAAAATV